MKPFRAPALLLALGILAACGGGVTPVPRPTATNRPAPARPSAPAPAPTPAAPKAAPVPVAPAEAVKEVAGTAPDPHSFAHPEEVAVEHLKLDLTVDFAQHVLTGRASLRLKSHGASRLVLDTRDLDIRGVTLDAGKGAAQWKLGDEVKFLGRPLEI